MLVPVSHRVANRRFTSVAALLALLAFVLIASRAGATVITLSGGESGEGFSPGPLVYAAVDFVKNAGQPPLTVQNVTFDTNAGAIVPPSATPYPSAAPSLGANPDDVNLSTVMQSLLYTGGPLTSTVSGLTPGRAYQFDLFVSRFGAPSGDQATEYRDSSNNLLASDVEFAVSAGNVAYDVANIVTAPADGIVKVIASIGTEHPDVPVVNALAVTYLPEPASLTLLAGGATMLLARRESRRK